MPDEDQSVTWWEVWFGLPKPIQVIKHTAKQVWIKDGKRIDRRSILSDHWNHFPTKEEAAQFIRQRAQLRIAQLRDSAADEEKKIQQLMEWEKKEGLR